LLNDVVGGVMTYNEETQLRARVARAGGIKPVARAVGMRPGTLSNKLAGWSYLLPEERRRLESVLAESERPRAVAATGGHF
jgi:hypothetical protein